MSEPAHLPATCSVCGATGYEARDPCPLHAAAPDLLAALEGLVAEYGIDSTSVKLLTDRCRNAWGQARAAIDKATHVEP